MNYILVVDDSAVDRVVMGHTVESRTGLGVKYAANGLDALEEMESLLPLAVVTDLNMPDMDGMRLVEEIRKRFCTVPVILVTQQGSEDIALRALVHGAADFVPKPLVAARLGEAVLGVLALSTGEAGHDPLLPLMNYHEARYTLDNDLDLVPSAANQLRQMAAALGLIDEADGVRLAKALCEALRNAVCHGNLELERYEAGPSLATAAAERRAQRPYCERRVHVMAVCTRDEARYTIRDEGQGFSRDPLPSGPGDPAQISAQAGRGLVLIRAFLDEVRFNPAGNEITLVKRRRQAERETRIEPSRAVGQAF